jgi:hypothetical protein
MIVVIKVGRYGHLFLIVCFKRRSSFLGVRTFSSRAPAAFLDDPIKVVDGGHQADGCVVNPDLDFHFLVARRISNYSVSSFQTFPQDLVHFVPSYALVLSFMVSRSCGVRKSPKIYIGSTAYSPTTLCGGVLYALWGLVLGILGESVGSFGAAGGCGSLGGQTEG